MLVIAQAHVFGIWSGGTHDEDQTRHLVHLVGCWRIMFSVLQAIVGNLRIGSLHTMAYKIGGIFNQKKPRSSGTLLSRKTPVCLSAGKRHRLSAARTSAAMERGEESCLCLKPLTSRYKRTFHGTHVRSRFMARMSAPCICIT